MYALRKLNSSTLKVGKEIPDDRFFLGVEDLSCIRADAIRCCDKEPVVDLFPIGFAQKRVDVTF